MAKDECRQYLRALVKVCEQCVAALDKEMARKEGFDRGRRIAKIVQHLELHKDMSKRFGLGKR